MTQKSCAVGMRNAILRDYLKRFLCNPSFLGIMAGSPCPIEVMKQVMTKLHMPQVTVSELSRV